MTKSRRPIARGVNIVLVLLCILVSESHADCPGPSNMTVLNLKEGAVVEFEGDSLVYGLDLTATGGASPINGNGFTRSRKPFPETVQSLLANRIRIVNHGFPGDRTQEGLSRWVKTRPTDAVFVMYGTNDFGNFGHHEGGPNDTGVYRDNLKKLVDRAKANSSHVVIMSPPPVADATADGRLETYRCVSYQVAENTGSLFINTPPVLKPLENKWVDGLHLSVAANESLAEHIARFLHLQKK